MSTNDSVNHVDAEARWREYLKDAPLSAFLCRRNLLVAPSPGAFLRQKLLLPKGLSSEMSKALIQLGWCLINVYYSDAEDVVIGLAAVQDNNQTRALPFRFQMQPSRSVAECVESMQCHDLASDLCTLSLDEIANLGTDMRNATKFDNQLAIFSDSSPVELELNRAVNIECTLSRGRATVQAFFDDSIISRAEMLRVLGTFDYLVQQLAEAINTGGSLGDINPISTEDFAQVAKWNQHLPPAVNDCMHNIIERMVQEKPSAEAVCALDVSLSYSQLNDMADRLAHHFVSKGVGPGHMVPFMFEKSPWVIPTLLAINKAGGAFVPLDPAHQWQDTWGLLNACDARFVVCSSTHEKRFAEHNIDRVVVGPSIFDSLPSLGPVSSAVEPTDAGYVIFTSGSTGTPKGVVCSHSAWCTITAAHDPREFNYAESRVLQFSAYTWDVSISDIFPTLAAGGTVCVPTEHERMNDIVGACNRMRVNHVATTPTVAQFLHPETVPTLEVLVTGGEPMPQEFVTIWADKVRLHNNYGPAECAGRVSDSLKAPGDKGPNIGTNLGAALWVARSNDPGRLVPIGAVGEMLVEGNTLADGYLKNEKITMESFINTPAWLKTAYPERSNGKRVYRTGDLVRQEADGSYIFLGRRDAQIKVHGVRLEAGHIEAKIRERLPAKAELVVDKITIGGSKAKQILVAFITLNSTFSPSQGIQLLPAEPVREFVSDLHAKLLASLPPYMVPNHLLVINAIPVGATGKVNRRAMREFVQGLDQDTLGQFTSSNHNSGAETPQSGTEIALSKLWAQVLDISLASISRQDNFFGRGGDSVSCMKLVSAGAAVGLYFSVADIFQHQTLAELGHCVYDGEAGKVTEPVGPFELIGGPNYFRLLHDHLRKSYSIAANRVEDIYPATPMQEGLMAENISSPEAYLLQEVLKLSDEVDIERLKSALKDLAQAYPVLRTRIARLKDHGTCQVVMIDNESLVTDSDMNLTSSLETAKEFHMGYGQALNQFTIVRNDGGRYLVWTTHHAVTDGHMNQLMLSKLELAYHGGLTEQPEVLPFNSFVKHISEPEKMANALEFWKKQLAGKTSHFPHCSDTHEPSITEYITHKTLLPKNLSPNFTPSILIRAAWAVVLFQSSNSTDVIMGVTQSGRDIALPGIHECLGPCLTTMPIRIRVDTASNMLVSEFLASVQQQYIDAIPHQHVGLQHVRMINDWCADAVGFRNLLVVQPASTNTYKLFTVDDCRNTGDQLNFGLLLECNLLKTGEVSVRIGFDSSLLSAGEASLMMHRLEHIYRQLSAFEDPPLSHLDMLSPGDMALLDGFNPSIEPLETCMHWLIEERARQQPDAMMIDSWDAQLTYRQANEYSDRLAGVLVGLGVGPEVIVPFAFEKSAWAIIAIHSILKAGGVCVALDMAHPRVRHEKIIDDTEARVVVSSAKHASKVSELAVRVVVIDRTMLDQLQPAHAKGSVSPRNAAWVVYSSGSTGTPKGSILEHRSLCSASRTNSGILRADPSARAIHFASYSFDVAIEESTIIPMYGGCICIPSDEERLNDLPGAMRRLKVNWADLTPTVARMLTPDNVPFMRTLVLGGEALTKDIIETWTTSGHAQIFNTYGPSECSINCTASKPLVKMATAANIGKPANCKLWVVDVDDPNRLLPVGVTGELLIEGPIVGRGYLKQLTKTKDAFLENLAWAGTRRFYRTGDLAKFNMDGTLDFLGREDSQIKLHGQRVELGEIEHHVKNQISGSKSQVAVEAFTPEGAPGRKLLAAFIQLNIGSITSTSSLEVMEMTESLRKHLVRLKSETTRHVPEYMVPSLFVPLITMPTNTSCKIDRRKLREAAAKFDKNQMMLYSLSQTTETTKPALDPTERLLASLWAETLFLNLEENPIRTSDNFLELGGDSIAAMQLVAKARAAGLRLSVTKIMKAPRLRDMALAAMVLDVLRAETAVLELVEPEIESPTKIAETLTCLEYDELTVEKTASESYSPFQLVSGKIAVQQVMEILADNYNLNPKAIVDVYPATPLQEGTMALSTRNEDSYVLRDIYELPADIDITKFKAAWDAVTRSHDILRTRVVFIPGVGSCQVVVDEEIDWQHAGNLDDYLSSDRKKTMGYGCRLARFAIVENARAKNFVWTVHHALYDGYSMGVTFAAVDNVYNNNIDVPPSPFVNVIRHLENTDKTTSNIFWADQLKDLETTPFPKAPTGYHPRANNTVSHSASLADRKSGITMATILRAAWSIVVSRLSDFPDIVFGVTQSGRDLDLVGIESLNGPTITTVPVRITVDNQTTLREFLGRLQTQAIDMAPFSHAGLQNIKKINSYIQAACEFQNLLVIQPAEQEKSPLFHNHRTVTTATYLSGYGLIVECYLGNNTVSFAAHHDSTILTAPQVERILRQFEHVLDQLQIYASGGRIQDIDMFCPADRADLVAWNSIYPKVVNECMHDIISQNAVTTPSAIAIVSRTVSLTYKELDELTNHLAHQLREMGVASDQIVPICIEKSPEGILAMIAIQKAGGAFVPLNPTDPPFRLRDLLTQANATLVIFSHQTSRLQETLLSGTSITGLVLPESLTGWTSLSALPTIEIKPLHLAYAIFTSGSTGCPKVVLITHRAVASSTYGHGFAMGFSEFPRRTVQFANYTFDSCIVEIFTTLSFGGCICVPTEYERMNDLAGFIRDFRCDWAFFTPTFVRLLKPDEVPCLKTVVLGGEVLNQECVDVWGDTVRLMNGYGPTETCVFAAARTVSPADRHKPETIGHPVSSIGWVVDPSNHNKLTPIGCVGELLIHGPNVARGYLDDEKKTAEVFVTSPKWLRAFGHVYTDVLYKTGDLVRQDVVDGSLTYLGRKDNQTKVNGQRLELGEIETHLKAREGVKSAVVLATDTTKGSKSQSLAAFIHFSDANSFGQPTSELIIAVDDTIRARIQELESAMRATLPIYMVPVIWIPIASIPIMPASGKTDRKALAVLLASLDTAQITTYSLGADDHAERQESATDMEKTVTKLIARTLGKDASEMGRTDSFFRLGGDSITAIQLVSAARALGITLSTELIFRQPRICDMAANAELTSGCAITHPVSPVKAFVLVPRDSRDELLSSIEREYNIKRGSIADVLPCTPLQEGLLALTIKDAEAYVLRETYRLPSSIDINRFKAAWEAVVRDTHILRTRIVQLGNGSFQVVVQDPIIWNSATKVQEYVDYDKMQPFGHGLPLIRFSLIETQHTGCYFVLTMHHAVYDGWSKRLILQHVQDAYRDLTALEKQKTPAFNRFIQYLQAADPTDANTFWKAQFTNLEAQSFPRLPSPDFDAVLDMTLTIDIPLIRKEGSLWTTGTLLKAAWAIVLGRYTGAPDALFGVVQAGRNVPIQGIAEMVGPTITTVPLRIKLDGDMPISKFLQAVQDQSTHMIPFEHTGLQNIARMSSECREACAFSNIMVIQPRQESDLEWMGAQRVENQDKGFLRFGMGLECSLGTSSVLLTGGYDQRLMSEAQMQRILRQLEAAIYDLNEKPENLVKYVNLVSEQDIAEMMQMNANFPEEIHEVTHDVIHQVALRQGNAVAINAWDVDFRYFELDQLSTKLAHHLISLGIGPEAIVPLCFEKSGWAIIAMLGVMKAGAAFVFLDPGYPMARLDDIVRQVGASVILVSLEQYPLWRGPVDLLIVDAVSIESLPSKTHTTLAIKTTPSNALYVIFTSGSTGSPKGCIIEHHSFLTCARAQANRSHMTSASRILQGSSYSFDVSVMEMLTALSVGACICVPNDRVKKRSIVDVIREFRVTWAFLTPSLVKTITPKQVPTLKTLVLGGEALTRQNIKTWAGKLRLFNGYGPSECTIAASAHAITHPDDDPANIGTALGGVCWIVDPEDVNKLAPLGTVGELIVEGGIVARGYLNQPEKTAEVFFEDPKWAAGRRNGGKKRRMYRTGDLAYFNTQGQIMFVGRKDAQVKVRGQRMELGEIETHMSKNKKIEHVVVLYPTAGPCKRQLVGIVSLARFGATTINGGEVILLDSMDGVSCEVADIAKDLARLVPRYMVPEVWIAVKSLPLLLSGKLNRKRVEQWLASMDEATRHRAYGMGGSKQIQPPSTPVEHQIQSVWAEVLKIPRAEIGVTQDFSTLGGDSILAMLVLAKLKIEGYRVTMADVASAKTIAQLATRITRTGRDSISHVHVTPETTDELFDLTPMQQFYANFALGNDYMSRQTNKKFNHTFCLGIKKGPISAASIQSALEALINRHGLLRARFQHDSTAVCGWRQYISTDTPGSYRFRSWDGVSVEQVKPALEQARQGLDIENGPMMAVDLITNENGQSLMMVTHHLVVDLVSWNTILADLEDYLLAQSFSAPVPYPFFEWVKYQKQHTITNFPPEIALPLRVPPENYDYWSMAQRINIYRDASRHTFILSEDDTTTLLTTCTKHFSAEPLDTLCSSLSHSFSYVFPDRLTPTLFRYNHGREPLGEADPSGTVGWLTTLSPIHVPVRKRDDSISVLKRAVAARKTLPMNGLGYFASRYFHPEGMAQFSDLDEMEVTVNYLGISDNQRRGKGGIFDVSRAIEMGLGAEGQEVKGFALFEITAEVLDGRLGVRCVWNGLMQRQDEIRRWWFEFGNALRDVAYQARKGDRMRVGRKENVGQPGRVMREKTV